MPTYRYRCGQCGEEFEQWQSITDDALTVHDGESGCGGSLSKVLAPAGIVLKGSGFYKTDNRSGSRNGNGSSSHGSSSESSSSSSESSFSSDSSKSSDSSSSSSSSSATSTSSS